MKGKMKKLFALLLALTFVFPVGLAAASAASNVPIIYVRGDQAIYKTDEEGNKYEVFDDGEYMDAFIDQALPLLPKALVTDDWTEYSQSALDVLLPAFDGFAPNPDGTLPEESGIEWSWSEATLSPTGYLVGRPYYEFSPDSRLSPLVIADQIHEYTEAVKRKTGASKVIFVSRCEGCNLLAAYLYKYAEPDGFAGVESVVFLNGCMNGAGHADSMLTGNMVIPSEAAYRFISHIDEYDLNVTFDAEMLGKVKTIFDMLHENYGLDVTAELITRIYNKTKDSFFAPFAKGYFGICGSFVACVSDHYDDYVDYIFAGEGDKETYADIIAMANEYHEKVQLHLADMLLAAKEKGVGVFVITEYGSQQYPISEDSELIGDYMLSVKAQSFGATTSKVDETLTEHYCNARAEAGYAKYISPDKQIDASTGLFPDTTWYIKNLIHDFPYQVDNMIGELVRDPNNTVDTTRFGQFLQYDKNRSELYAMEEVNDNDINWESAEPGSGTKGFVQMLIDFFQRAVAWVRTFINGIVGHANGTA